MGLLLVLALLGGAFAVLNWLLLPRLERSWVTASTHAKYSKAGTIAAFKTLRTFLQIAIATSLFTLIAATAIWLGGQIGWDMSLTVLHEFTGWVLGWLESLGKSLGLALTWLAVAGLGWMAYRVARKGLRGDLDHEFAAQKQELAKQWSEDQLPVLPPSAEMDACAEQLARAQALRDSLAQDPAGNEAALQALDDTIAKLVSFFVNSDLDRRIDLTTVPLPIDQGPGWWPQIRVLLFSRGTLRLSERTKTYVTRLATAAACFAVVGVSAPALANGAIAPLFASLTDLRVFASADRAARTLSSFAQAPVRPPMPPMPPGAADDAADDDVYVRTATHFVRALARPQVWASGVEQSVPGTRVLAATSQQQRRDLGGTMIREALLREYSAGRPGAGLASEGLAGLADEGVQTRYDRMVDGLEPDPARRFSGLVGRVEGYLRAEGARRPGFEAQLRAGLAQFRQPVQAWDYASAALGDVVGEALKEALPEVGTPRPPIERTAIKKGVERLVEIKLAGFLENVRAGKPVAQSLGEVARPESMPTLRMAEARSMSGSFDQLELDAADLRRGSAAKAPSLRIVVSEAERARAAPFAQLVSKDLPARKFGGALGNYDALFESHARSVGKTALAAIDPALTETAKLVADAASGGGGAPATKGPNSPDRFQIARSTFAMSRSFRVGGVVIGEMPQAGSRSLDFEGLAWVRNGGSFDLALVRRDGRRLELGSFSGEMIQLALAYAADARTVAVTMTSPAPVDLSIENRGTMLRVNLHPALRNTRLGADLIELDRFVDEAKMRCDSGLTVSRAACEERDRVNKQLQVYRVAERLVRERPQDSGDISSQLGELASSAFPQGWNSSDPRISVFAAHPTYFDAALAKAIVGCAQRDSGDYMGCVSGVAFVASNVPENTVWSGVRDRSFRLGERALTDDGLRFMLQVAFDLGTGDPDDPERAGLAFADDGKSAWEFPMIADAVERDVAAMIAADPDRGRILESARKFTRLQRLFRLALAGELGAAFDSGQLLTLMRAAKREGAVRLEPTPDWSLPRFFAEEKLDRMRVQACLKLDPPGEDDASTLRKVGSCLAAERDPINELDGSIAHDCSSFDDGCYQDLMFVRSAQFLAANLADPAVRFSGD